MRGALGEGAWLMMFALVMGRSEVIRHHIVSEGILDRLREPNAQRGVSQVVALKGIPSG